MMNKTIAALFILSLLLISQQAPYATWSILLIFALAFGFSRGVWALIQAPVRVDDIQRPLK